MLALAVAAMVGVSAVVALSLDDDDDDDDDVVIGDMPLEDDDPEMTITADGGEPVEYMAEDLEDGVVEGTAADEEIAINPETQNQYQIQLESGGEDTVSAGLGHRIETLDAVEDGETQSPDTVSLKWLPDADQPVTTPSDDRDDSETYSIAETVLVTDPEDSVDLEVARDTGGSLLPLYVQKAGVPGSACCSYQYDHELVMYHIPEGETFDEDEFLGTPWWEAEMYLDDKGYTPLAKIDLGSEGQINDPEEPSIILDTWDTVRESPILTSNLTILDQVRLITE